MSVGGTWNGLVLRTASYCAVEEQEMMSKSSNWAINVGWSKAYDDFRLGPRPKLVQETETLGTRQDLTFS